MSSISPAGALSAHVGVLSTRLTTIQSTSGGALAKLQALMASAPTAAGAHLTAARTGGLLSQLGGGSGLGGLLGTAGTGSSGSTPPATDAAFASNSERLLAGPVPPANVAFR